MFIIAGLGNPGAKYENTRHNLGYIVVEQLAQKHSISVVKSKFKSLVGEGQIAGEKVLIIKPETFMNNSGEAIREAADFYKLDHGNILVVYDDVDIPLGNIRIRPFGSAGTHNGMRSVTAHIGEDFPRIRIGIGRDEPIRIYDYVLGGFTKEEVEPLERACLTAVEAINCYIEQGIDIAMNRYNSHPKRDKEGQDSDPETPTQEGRDETKE